jgi:hypothetical protein
VLFLSICRLDQPNTFFSVASISTELTEKLFYKNQPVVLLIDKASTKLENSNLGERSHLEGTPSLAPFWGLGKRFLVTVRKRFGND